jgi:hypothetical protein
MPRPKKPKSGSQTSAKKSTLKSLPVRAEVAGKVDGGKRTNVRDANDKYAN